MKLALIHLNEFVVAALVTCGTSHNLPACTLQGLLVCMIRTDRQSRRESTCA